MSDEKSFSEKLNGAFGSGGKSVTSGRPYFQVATKGSTVLLASLDVETKFPLPLVALTVRFRETGPRVFTCIPARQSDDDGVLLSKFSLFMSYLNPNMSELMSMLVTDDFDKKLLTALTAISERHGATMTVTEEDIQMRLETLKDKHLEKIEAAIAQMKFPDFSTMPLDDSTPPEAKKSGTGKPKPPQAPPQNYGYSDD